MQLPMTVRMQKLKVRQYVSSAKETRNDAMFIPSRFFGYSSLAFKAFAFLHLPEFLNPFL
jgi:hypothetical protein